MKQNQYIERRIAVPEAFEEVFTHFYIAENHTGEAIAKTLVPSFQTMFIFNFGPPISMISPLDTTISLDECFVLGPLKQSLQYTLPAGADMLVANFKSDAFYRFFGQVSVLEVPVHPDALLEENCFTNLWHQLKSISSQEERVQFILEFCRPYIRNREAAVNRLVKFLETDDKLNPVKAIAYETDKSERAIQLQHKKYLGFSAKEIIRYKRFLKVMELLQHMAPAEKADWFTIIEQCGYYDQSQLIHDFQHYLHLSPSKYLKFQQDICVSNL